MLKTWLNVVFVIFSFLSRYLHSKLTTTIWGWGTSMMQYCYVTETSNSPCLLMHIYMTSDPPMNQKKLPLQRGRHQPSYQVPLLINKPTCPFHPMAPSLDTQHDKDILNSFNMAFLIFYGSQTFISMLTEVHPESNPHSHILCLSNTLYLDFFLKTCWSIMLFRYYYKLYFSPVI